MRSSVPSGFIIFSNFVFYVAILIGAGLHIVLDKHKDARTPRRIVELVLLYVLVIGVGLQSLYAFMGHVFFADETARQIGWPTGNPFQFEVAIANLAIGVLGILCVWIRGTFWYATGIVYAIWILGDFYGHVYQAVVHGNYAPANLGLFIYCVVVFAFIVLGLLVAYHILNQRTQARSAESFPV